jgi:phosphate:Na+ symporter
MAMGLNRYALRLHPPDTTPWPDPDAQDPVAGRRSYAQRYERLKRLEGELVEYVVELQSRELPSETGRTLVNQLEAMRLAVISAKSVKDVRQNLVELRLALRGAVDGWLSRFDANAERLYGALDHLDPAQSASSTIEALAQLRNDMREARDAIVADLYRAAGRHELDELELSTLFNINRELHSSAKALLRALSVHLLPPAAASVLEASGG